MKPPVETVRVSAQGRDQLLKLKRQTGIENWNVLCRWALCASLRERSSPPQFAAVTEGGVEMTWKVFAGESADILASVIQVRAAADGYADLPDGTAQCLRAHLHRGLGYVASEVGDLGVAGFMRRWLFEQRSKLSSPVS